MTIQLLHAFNGYSPGIYSNMGAPEEARLIGLGLARAYVAGMDGVSSSGSLTRPATDAAQAQFDATGSIGGSPLSIIGGSAVGSLLTAKLAPGWSVTGYQWVRVTDGTPADISGATSSTYMVAQADQDKGITVRVTGLIYTGVAVSVPLDPTLGYDVILLAGQSNMAGRGTYNAGIDTTDPKVFQWDGYSASGTYQTIIAGVDRLKHPELGTFNVGQTVVGPGMFFAKAYAARTGRKVLLVPAAWGGTGLVGGSNITWNIASGSNREYANAIAQANAAIAAGGSGTVFKGILWFQGEADAQIATVSALQYQRAWRDTIAGLRAGITGASSAWVVASHFVPEAVIANDGPSGAGSGQYPAIDAALDGCVASIVKAAIIAGRSGYSGDALHYTNPVGARLAGADFDAAVTTAIAYAGPAAPGQVTGLAVGSRTDTSVTLTFSTPTGGIPTDYEAQYSPAGAGTWTTYSDGPNNALTITVGGLTASTNYDFRVRATNVGGNGAYSSTVTQATDATATPIVVRFGTLTGVTEAGDGTAGWTYSAAATVTAATCHAGVSSKKLPAGADGWIQYKFRDSRATTRNGILGMVESNTDPAWNAGASGYKFGVIDRNTGVYAVINNGSATIGTADNSVTTASNDTVRLRRAGSTIFAEVARIATPTTWVLIHTFAATSAADLWFAAGFTNTSGTIDRGPILGSSTVVAA